MKKILLLFIITSFTFHSKAQSWCTLGSTWHYSTISPSNGYTKYTYLYDTLVGANLCNKIKYEVQGVGMAGPFDYSDYIYTYEQNGIVFKNNGTLSTPHYDTLYNFTGTVGTKWRTNPTGGQACSQSYIEITGSGSINIQGQTLNYRTINYTNFYYLFPQMSIPLTGSDTIFERIGTRHGMEFITGYNCADMTDVGPVGFRCFSDNQINLQMSSVACDYVTKIENNQMNSIKLELNNPASDFVHINIKDKVGNNTRIVLTDQFGKKISEYLLIENEIDISTQNITSGLYLLQFYIGTELITRKLLIQK